MAIAGFIESPIELRLVIRLASKFYVVAMEAGILVSVFAESKYLK